MTVIYILVAILIFGFLIAIHEFGHFIVAKLCGVRVDEFAIGMGPALFKKQKGETLYALRAFPIGGFCAMAEDESSEDPRAFVNKAAWKRALILAAGSFNNLVIGFLIVMVLYSTAAAFRSSTIAEFTPDCPYVGEDMLMVGDEFYKIDGKRILLQSDISEFLSNGKTEHDIVIERDGKKIKLDAFKLVPVELEGRSQKGYGFYLGYEEANIKTIVENAWKTSLQFARMVFMALQQLINGDVGVKDLSGPVGVVDLMAEVGESSESFSDGLFEIFYLGAFIAINLGMMNMLPIPALDGGRVFLLLVTFVIESITRKKLNPKYEGYIHAAGMILLLALMAFVMFNDIIRIVTK